MIAICHYTLYRALFVRRLPLWPYAVCAALALALEKITMARVLRFPVWKAINMYVARTTAALLTITGYQTVCHPNPDPGVIMPFLGTDRFVVQIGTPCAGIEGATAFLIMYAALVFINRKKLNKKRALWALPLGLVIMQVTNILRIYVLVLIGHYTDSQKAVDLWHGHGSLFYYVAILMITMFLFDRWITSPPPDQK
jgi:exosortase/archaeosortase family protein